MNKKIIKYINLENLKLDFLNPRLPIEPSSEDDIIEWMLSDASILKLMLAIGQNGFFIGEALLVIKENEKYSVLDGNRKLTALKILNNPELATIHKRKIRQILSETTERPISIPCIEFERREDVFKYLGYKHITGIKSWGMLEKAKYLNSLVPTLKSKDFSLQARELAKKIGSRSDYVKIQLISFQIYRKVVNNNFYKIPNLNEETFLFHYLFNSLKYEHIRSFMSIDLDTKNPFDIFTQNGEKNLSLLINWLYRKNEQERPKVYGSDENLMTLDLVLSTPKSLKYFLNGKSLQESLKYVNHDVCYH